jgi:hypothetical protein
MFYFMFHHTLYFLFHVSLSNAISQIVHYLFRFRFEIFSLNWTPFLRSTDKIFRCFSLGPIRYTTRSKDGSKRMCGVRCYENATLLRPVRKLTIPPSERHFAYYPLANEVAMGYSNATIRHSVRLSVRPSFRRSFPNILVNTLESTSFNGFWPHLVHT